GLLPILEAAVHSRNGEVGFEAEDFFFEVVIEPAHDAQDDDEHGDTEHDADNADQSDDGNERALGTQVAQRDHQLEGQPRHAREGRARVLNLSNAGGPDPCEMEGLCYLRTVSARWRTDWSGLVLSQAIFCSVKMSRRSLPCSIASSAARRRDGS